MNGSVDAPPRASKGMTAHGRRRQVRPRVATRESLSFLAEVGNALAASLDYETTLQQVADLTVPRLACYCELGLLRDGGVQSVGLAHADPDHPTAVSERMLLPTRLDRGPIAEVLSNGESLLVACRCEPSEAGLNADSERLELLAEISFQRGAIANVRARRVFEINQPVNQVLLDLFFCHCHY